MICFDCTHVIIRIIGVPYEEPFYFCDIDGIKIVTLYKSCNRYEKEEIDERKRQEERQEEKISKEEVKESDEFICEICGKSLMTKLALAGHKRSHK